MNGVYLYLGNTDLKAQTSNYFGVSAEYTLGHLTMTLSGYYNKVDNMIALVTIPTSEAPGDLIVQYDPMRVHLWYRLYGTLSDQAFHGRRLVQLSGHQSPPI